MRILVDTSVWSLALRRKKDIEHNAVNLLRKFIEDGEDLFLIGVILQEILSGISDEKLFTQLEDQLSAFPIIDLKRQDYVEAANLRNACRKKGVQVGTIDALIASVCIKNDLLLLSTDKDFQQIAKNSELQLIK
jgi:predicted nucleic acid-binding protein